MQQRIEVCCETKNKQFLGSAAQPRNSSSFILFAESRSSFMRATMHFAKTAVRIFEYTFQPQNPRLKAHDEPLSQITANLVSKPTLMLIPGKKCESFLLTPIPVFFF